LQAFTDLSQPHCVITSPPHRSSLLPSLSEKS
jgi:hypothetical protein